MKVKKTWENVMAMIEYLYIIGYTVSMHNHKRWSISVNDNLGNYVRLDECLPLPKIEEEIRGNKSDRYNHSNLDDVCELLESFVNIWMEYDLEQEIIQSISKETNVVLSIAEFLENE